MAVGCDSALTTAGGAERQRDPLLQDARLGRPLRARVVDAHAHVLHEGGQTAGGILMRDGDAAGMVSLNGCCGIDTVAMMSWAGPVNMDATAGNDVVARAMQRFPDAVRGLCTVDPLQ